MDGVPRNTRRASNLISPGFPLAAKLALLCSPLFISLSHSWRLHTLQNLSEQRPDNRLQDMFHYLSIEIIFCVMSMPVSMLSDSLVGLTVTLLSFISASCLSPMLSNMIDLPGIDVNTRVYMLKLSACFAGLCIIASVMERAYFVSLIHVDSPSFRLYCFLCYFFSVIWQVLNATLLYTPKFFPYFFEEHSRPLAWVELAYQLALWAYILIMYILLVRLKRPEHQTGNSIKVLACIYLAIWYGLKVIWARLRRKEPEVKDIFEICEQWYPRKVVNEMRQTFRLFIVLMCLMYLFGMEPILRSIWFHQDDIMSRHPKVGALTVFPLELVMLLYLLVLYPIVNFLVIPFIRKKLHFKLSDLRLLGIALIFMNLSYISTMALEWTVLSATVSSPNVNNVAIRVYNAMVYPLAWTVKHPGITPVTIFQPARTSEMYVNEIMGAYEVQFNSSVFSNATSLYIERGKSKVFFLRNGILESIAAMEKQISATPNFSSDDSHLFVINALSNTTKEYLANKEVEVSCKPELGPAKSTKITSDVTHMILGEGKLVITLRMGNRTFDMKMETKDYGVYSIMFYDSWSGQGEGYELDTVSVGFIYTRIWANIQLILLALGLAVGQIPMVHYTYKNAPPGMVATCFSFHKCASAFSTFIVWSVSKKYGLGPGPSTVSTLFVLMFTVFFIFLSVSDIVPTDDDVVRGSQSRPSGDDLMSNSGSLRFVKSMLVGDTHPEVTKPKVQFPDQDIVSNASVGKESQTQQ